MIIFGGQRGSHEDGRKVLNDILSYDFYLKEWKQIKPNINAMTVISHRRDHAACVMGHVLYVYGGKNKVGDYYNDVWEFYFKKRCWYKNRVIIPENMDNWGIAYHTMTAVWERYRIYSKTASKYIELNNQVFLKQ